MNWENYGQYWHIDHVIPLSLANVKDEKEIKKVLCWENTRALKASENLKKKNKLDNKIIKKHAEQLQNFKLLMDNPHPNTISIGSTTMH